MRGSNALRILIATGLCLMIPMLNGCQEPGKQATSSAPAAQAPAPSSPLVAPTPGSAGAAPASLVTYQPPQAVNLLANCNLEQVDGHAFGAGAAALQSSRANTFTGWIDAGDLPNPAYWIRFDDTQTGRHLQASLPLTQQRPDVAAAHPGAPLVSGFSLSVPSGAMAPGTYHVYLAVESEGKSYVCDNGRDVQVSP